MVVLCNAKYFLVHFTLLSKNQTHHKLITFEWVKINSLFIFIFLIFIGKAQDKIYFIDGSTLAGKVVEIGIDQITIDTHNQTESFPRKDVLLIVYKNGSFEKINFPENDVIYSEKENFPRLEASNDHELFLFNQGSVNTLALCNADISGFYERILKNKKVGLGIMGAYNFNTSTSISNIFIAVLNNSKKTYDLGAFVNFYPSRFKSRNLFYFGMMMKYTRFTFVKVTEVAGGSSLSFSPARGGQLATMGTVGSQHFLAQLFFVKTLFGLGGFNLRGDYRQQYNYATKTTRAPATSKTRSVDVGFLLKVYLELNIGFTF